MTDIKVGLEIEKAGESKVLIYKISIQDGGHTLEKTYGSKEAAEAFLEGLKTAFNFTTKRLEKEFFRRSLKTGFSFTKAGLKEELGQLDEAFEKLKKS